MFYWSVPLRAMITNYVWLVVWANTGSIFDKDDILMGNELNYFAVFLCGIIPYIAWSILTYHEKNELDMASTKQLYGSLYNTLYTDNLY